MNMFRRHLQNDIVCDIYLIVILIIPFAQCTTYKIQASNSAVPYNIVENILRDQNVPNYGVEDEQMWKNGRTKRSVDSNIPSHPSRSTKKPIISFDKGFTDTTVKISTTKIANVNQLNKNSNKTIRRFSNIENIAERTSLDLSKNNISILYIDEETRIESLNLNDNTIESIVVKFSTHTLKVLTLRNNNLTSFHRICLNLTQFNELETLDLSENHFDEIYPFYSVDKNNSNNRLNNVKHLNLSRNHLGGIHKDTFSTLFNLNSLILSYNNISFIDDDAFIHLSNLEYLDLSFNKLHANSLRAIQNALNVIGLSIAYNSIVGKYLPEFVTSWSLKEFDASGTNLCAIPVALAQSVKILNIKDNWISVIQCGDLESFPLLEILDVSTNHIVQIEDDAFGRLEILQTLFLDKNKLTIIPTSLPESLENLFLQDNKITEVQSQTFSNLINLKILDLSDNQILYLPELKIPTLQILNLQYSGLHKISQTLSTSPQIKEILLDGNYIKCSDLLGMAEWASPCQNKLPEKRNIKLEYLLSHQEHFIKLNPISLGHYTSNIEPKCAKYIAQPPTKTENIVELLANNNNEDNVNKNKKRKIISNVYILDKIYFRDRHLLGTPLIVNSKNMFKETNVAHISSKENKTRTEQKMLLFTKSNTNQNVFHNQLNDRNVMNHDKVIHKSIEDRITNDDLDNMMRTNDYNIKDKLDDSHYTSDINIKTSKPVTRITKNHHSINMANNEYIMKGTDNSTKLSLLPSSTEAISKASIANSKHEQWLEIRTESNGHPGLFIVVGLMFCGILLLGLVQIYRCNYDYHIHDHINDINHIYGSEHTQYITNDNEFTVCQGECYQNENSYLIEMNQNIIEPSVSSGVDCLPMELLSSSSHISPAHLLLPNIAPSSKDCDNNKINIYSKSELGQSFLDIW